MKRLALALVVLLALTGCAEIGSLRDKAQIDLGLQALTSDLAALGVDTTYTAELTPEFTYVVRVQANAPELTASQLVDVAGMVNEHLGSDFFSTLPVTFELQSPAGLSLAANEFSATPDQLSTDIEYAAAVGAAYGAPATMFIGLADDSHPYALSVGVLGTSESPDWDALRAMVYEGDAELSWSFPGVSFGGELPSAEVTTLVDELGKVAPLLTSWTMESHDSFLDIYLAGDDFSVSYSATGLDVENPRASPTWQTTVALVRLILDSGVGPVTFSQYPFNGGGTGYASVGVGTCAPTSGDTAESAALAAALSAELGVTVQPGMCIHA